MKRGLKRLKFQKKRAGIGQRGLEVWTPPPKPQNFTPPLKKTATRMKVTIDTNDSSGLTISHLLGELFANFHN